MSVVYTQNPAGQNTTAGQQPLVSVCCLTIAAGDDFHSKYSPLPDYSIKLSEEETVGDEAASHAGWTSFAGVVGSLITMAVIWVTAWFLRKKQPAKA